MYFCSLYCKGKTCIYLRKIKQRKFKVWNTLDGQSFIFIIRMSLRGKHGTIISQEKHNFLTVVVTGSKVWFPISETLTQPYWLHPFPLSWPFFSLCGRYFLELGGGQGLEPLPTTVKTVVFFIKTYSMMKGETEKNFSCLELFMAVTFRKISHFHIYDVVGLSFLVERKIS